MKIDFGTIRDRSKTNRRDGRNNVMDIESVSTESYRHDTGSSGSSIQVSLLESASSSAAPQSDTSEIDSRDRCKMCGRYSTHVATKCPYYLMLPKEAQRMMLEERENNNNIALD